MAGFQADAWNPAISLGKVHASQPLGNTIRLGYRQIKLLNGK